MITDQKTYRIRGVVIASNTVLGVEGLRVEVWDKDFLFDNALGTADTGAQGAFEIVFDPDRFEGFFEREHAPDLYFKVFLSDDCIGSTENSVLWNRKSGDIPVRILVDMPLFSDETADSDRTLEISASLLSFGAQGYDVARVHQAFQALGRNVPAIEIANRVLGVGTVAVLKALQQELGLPPTGIVDAVTVRSINIMLGKLATNLRVVRGLVRDATGNLFAGGFVQIFGQGLNGEKVLGRSPLRNGSYQISYQLPPESNGRVDLRVAVLDANGLVETTPSGASLLTNAGLLEVVNFVLSGDKNLPSAEYDFLLDDLKPFLGTRDFAELTEESSRRDVSLLASQSGYSTDQVAALVLAHKLAKETGIPPPVFYGMLRQGLPSNTAALYAVHPAERVKALKVAAGQGLVPKEIAGKKIEDYLADLVPKPPGELQELLGHILNPQELSTFVGQYLKNSQNPDAFWQQVADDPAWSGRAADLKFTVQLGVLTNNVVPLVTALRALPDVQQVADLTRLTEDRWKTLIQTPGVGAPTETPGATPDEKTGNYVQQLMVRVEAAFPTLFFAERLGTSPVSTFLKAQPTYDLRTTYPEQFFKQNPAAAQTLQPKDREQLRNYQRLYQLTGGTTETLALAAKGIHSAQQIVQMDRTMFAGQHKEVISGERANIIYNRARGTHAAALALFVEHSAALNRTGLHALPQLDSQKQAALAANSIPDWQTLFGTFDLCACQECASVHGPAAYFVDMLHFLGERNARAPLFARRPDLGDIELSCENTNTPLPLIDLANEVLENAVALPPLFAPFTLAPALETDLAQTIATPELAVAFSPPLQAGTRIETIEAGRRWRVWDEPFAYSVDKEGSALTVIARSRQTTGSAADRRASPQYRNSEAYAELNRSVYPWNLPFDLPNEETKVFLAHLGVSRRDLMEALRPMPEPFDPIVVRLAAERLGLSDTERRILVGEPLAPPPQQEDFWGGASLDQLTTVQELLDRSGLNYAELEDLIATWFLNPAGAMMISAIPDEPIQTCDTTRLQLNGLSVDVLDRLHRFVRLWRKLGWTILEVDRAMHALVPDPNQPILTNDLLVRLDQLQALSYALRLSIPQTLALWKPIDTAEPGSLYRKLFYNPAVFKPQDDLFRLSSDGQELDRTDGFLADHVAAGAIQAVFRLNAEGFAILLAKTDGQLNLANLSLMYRYASLARQLGLTVQDLVTAIEVTRLDPFRAERSEDSLRFVEVVKAIRSSRFDFTQLDYLIRHHFNSASSFVPMDSTMAQTLMEVRDGLLKIDATSDPEPQKLQKSAVIDRISAALGLPADVTGVLLSRVSHGGVTAQQWFIALSGIDRDTVLSRDLAMPQFETLEKLLKVATIIQTLQLPGSQMDWLFRENAWLSTAPDSPANPALFAEWFSLIELQQLRAALNLEDAALEVILTAITAVSVAVNPLARLAARKDFVETLSHWLGWSASDLETLIGASNDIGDLGLLNVQIPDGYRINLVVRLHRAISLLKRVGVAADEASQWCEIMVTDAHAKAIRQAAKAKHDDDTWQRLVVPLQDSLRDKQREALVSYLAARPVQGATVAGSSDAHVLYSQFLIDVEMSSCQLTSRIKQAIGSVQLFAQRCLMGLEEVVSTDDPKWEQWSWMKNFRVWEANRKIWLYPENWIEPQLRDDKTPFFKDLENELLQSDLNNASAEQALQHYLEKLDEVARLEIVGTYEDDETKDLHIFGRTFHTPHIYYYRYREGKTKLWSSWVKVELDIEGDHLIPVIWNRKLMVIWPIFTEKSKPKDVMMPEPGNTLESAKRYWEIQLAWSDYQNDRWSGKNLSEGVAFEAHQDKDNVLFGRPDDSDDASRLKTVYLCSVNDDDCPPDPPINDDGTGGDSGDPTHTQTNPSAKAKAKELVARELFSFKALVPDENFKSLIVRGFLRRDYRKKNPDIGDVQIACCFGEFRFSGCRKIVTTAHRGKISGLNIFPLAPSGTKFDHMWYTGDGSGLMAFDGKFPVGLPHLDEVNKSASIAGDPSSMVNNKFDIPVLDHTPGSFRLLAPHQDQQFVGDRPFFFMDTQRAFLASSTGSSGNRTSPHLGDWVRGDLAVAWRTDYFPPPAPALPEAPVPAPNLPGEALQPYTVLLPGPQGRRVATQLTPVNLNPTFSPRTLVPAFWTTRKYRFINFHHPYLCEFVKTLNSQGITKLLSLESQRRTDSQSFDAYQPQDRVLTPRPIDEVEFQADRAYAAYNWELFFHIPLLIADQLSRNQRFEEAQRWFHFIFDPTGATGGGIPQRYWLTMPFNDRLDGDYERESVKTIEEIVAKGISPEWETAIAVWRNNPFSPHAVARLRTTAYQKTVVMKYIDNLIAWGDQLFRRETLESINEATHLYVLAAEILGRSPEVIQRNVKPAVKTFNSLAQLGLLSNALEQIELLVTAGDSDSIGESSETPDPPSAQVLYFCVPENDKLLGYWNRVADRLFKIRHCMNIEGQVRQLPLFEPPIDPALLVRARAAGLSIGEVLSDISVSLPNYRFSFMLQKANELVAEVRNLGAALLSALEKRDAEALSTLRSGQELRLLQAIQDIRKKQIDEAEASIASLEKSREMAQARKDYYGSREFLNEKEISSQDSLQYSLYFMEGSGALRGLAALLGNLGIIKLGSPTTAGLEIGPSYMAGGLVLSASALDVMSAIFNVNSQLSGRMADHDRRKDEWDHQANLATIELKQIDQQLTAAQIRLAVAEQELRNHNQQIDNAQEVDQFLRGKFTNQDLYQWMIGQVSGLYFQSYQLAYDIAKRAEHCFRYELGLSESNYIQFGYWDSLKKGLLSGEKLQYDLRRLETAYLEQNRREFELTKHISLVLLNPLALVKLRETGRCDIDLPEEILDLDFPGHYFRRIKSVSITLPCVVGPYTTISCTLRLLKNSIRINTANGDNGYPRNTDDTGLPADDDRFIENNIPVKAIAASNAQNDSGVFELSFRDERYLPFEGAGVISQWSLELFSDLPSNNPDPGNPDYGRPLRQFDYGTITDAILHIKYTAREDAGPFKDGAITHLRDYLSQDGATPSLRLFNLRQEFPTQWHRFLNPTNPASGNIFELEMAPSLFRILDINKTLKVNKLWLFARCTDAGSYTVNLTPPLPAEANTLTLVKIDIFGGLHANGGNGKDVSGLDIRVMPTDSPVKWQLKMTRPGGGDLQKDEVEDLIMVLGYEWE